MILLRQYVAGDGFLRVLYVPARRVNQQAHLHFLFVVRNQSLFVNVADKTADENPFSNAKITICHQQSVSFHRVPCCFTHFALYMYTFVGKVSFFFCHNCVKYV